MPEAFFYINIVYFIIFKWNIELLQIFIFELVQYICFQYFQCANTRHSAPLFSIEIKRKHVLLYNKTIYYTVPPIICVF
jgi:hypothetical protein